MPTLKNESPIFDRELTLQQLCFAGGRVLERAGVPDARHDAAELLFSALDITRNEYVMKMSEKVPDDTALMRYADFILRRAEREPLQYITGRAYFMGLEFAVNQHVLVPRYDSETLVEAAFGAVKAFRNSTGKPAAVMDMCTGSGCLILALLNEVRNESGADCISGTGYDISEGALETARVNAERLGITCDFVQSDLFENVGGTYDVILSNPPYIKTDVIRELDPEVRDFEPHIALDGGRDGLSFYRIITDRSRKALNRNGVLLFEIGNDEGEAVSGILKENGFREVKVLKDLCENDRVVMGEWTDDN